MATLPHVNTTHNPYRPAMYRVSTQGHSTGQVTWALPRESPTHYQAGDTLLGHRTTADAQYAADEAAGGLVMLALGRR
jgi:hypothetical protein